MAFSALLFQHFFKALFTVPSDHCFEWSLLVGLEFSGLWVNLTVRPADMPVSADSMQMKCRSRQEIPKKYVEIGRRVCFSSLQLPLARLLFCSRDPGQVGARPLFAVLPSTRLRLANSPANPPPSHRRKQLTVNFDLFILISFCLRFRAPSLPSLADDRALCLRRASGKFNFCNLEILSNLILNEDPGGRSGRPPIEDAP